jgi:hypothetical protein
LNSDTDALRSFACDSSEQAAAAACLAQRCVALRDCVHLRDGHIWHSDNYKRIRESGIRLRLGQAYRTVQGGKSIDMLEEHGIRAKIRAAPTKQPFDLTSMKVASSTFADVVKRSQSGHVENFVGQRREFGAEHASCAERSSVVRNAAFPMADVGTQLRKSVGSARLK